MPDTPSITINKLFTYRGQPEEYSNTYHFSGTTPATFAAWKTLYEAIRDTEKALVPSSTKYVGFLGYEAGNKHAVALYDPRDVGDGLVQGSFNYTSGSPAVPGGDVAQWVRWVTPDRTSRGKKIYLRKYFHGIPSTNDVVHPDWTAAATIYAGKMKDGTLPGSFRICGPQGAVAGASTSSVFTTTRTLKRRGKRPSSR